MLDGQEEEKYLPETLNKSGIWSLLLYLPYFFQTKLGQKK